MVKILVIEPDAKLAEIYCEALSGRGFSPVHAATAQDAIIAADQARPDVVLLELQLTAHSGIEFLYEFRSYTDWAAVPVIIVSHVPPTEFAASRLLLTKQLGVVAYHYKPRVNLQSIIYSVDNVLAASQRAA